MKLIKMLFVLLLAITIADAEQYTPQGNNRGNSSIRVGTDVPDTARTNRYLYPEILRDRVEMETSRNYSAYKDIQAKEDHRKKVLDGVYDTDISMKPEYRLLQKTDLIKISPKFVTAILLPTGTVITDAKASFSTNTAGFHNNIMKIQPKDYFYMGNIFITFTDGKKNYYMTIVAERYFQNRAEVKDYISAVKKSSPSIAKKLEQQNSEVDDYAYSREHLSLTYQYLLPSVLSPEDAIVLYEKMTKTKGINIDDGDYVSFLYDGVTYKIIRDDRQGTLIYGKKAYRVENSLEAK